jgi:hypothetical protein
VAKRRLEGLYDEPRPGVPRSITDEDMGFARQFGSPTTSPLSTRPSAKAVDAPDDVESVASDGISSQVDPCRMMRSKK